MQYDVLCLAGTAAVVSGDLSWSCIYFKEIPRNIVSVASGLGLNVLRDRALGFRRGDQFAELLRDRQNHIIFVVVCY